MTATCHEQDHARDRAPEPTHDHAAATASEREPERAPAPVTGARGSHDLAALAIGAGRGASLWRGPVVQTKLTVGVPGDPLEREADAVAARAVRGADPRPPAAPDLAVRGRLLRSTAPARGPPPAPGSAEPGSRSVGSIVAQGGGRPLDAAVRGRIEPHVGMDLGSVRVRDGPDAAAAAHALHARAFTSGSTIFLAASSSPTDVGLMAHEATHVVQQTSRPATRATLMRDLADLLPDISLPDVSVADVIPAWIIDGVSSALQLTPGYMVLTLIAGTDPLTGAPVQVTPGELVERVLSLGPFDAAVSGVLEAIGVVGDVFDVLSAGLAANDLTLGRIQRDFDSAWAQLSITGGIDGNLAIIQGYVERLVADVAAFVASIAARVVELVRAGAATATEALLATPAIAPIWSLGKKVLHYDPLRGVPVEAPTVEILADFLRVIGEEARLAQMEERGTLQETADWLDTQFETFAGLVSELGALFSDAWAAIQPENLPDLLTNLADLAQREFALAQGIGTFAFTVIAKVLELVRHALLGWLSEYAHLIPGFHLLTVIVGQNPFTGEVVPLTAETLIRGFVTLMPGGEATYDQLAQSGVIAAAAARIEGAITDLGLTPELVVGTFLGIWNALTLDDLLDPIPAFVRVLEGFGEPLLRIVAFVPVVIQVVIELILALMNFPSELLGSIFANVASAIGDIARDPVGFLLNMVEALKAGFTGFFANIVSHLTQGLVDWLFRGLRDLGITAPPDFTLASILDLIFQVLGLTAEDLWAKLAEHLDADTVAMIRDGLSKLTGAWAFLVDVRERGLSAIWELVASQLSSLWETLLGVAMEWVMTQIITSGTIKLLSFLDPTFIMSVINGCIAFFNAVQAAIDYFRDLLEILNLYVGTLAQVAAGNIAPGAQMIEKGFAAAVPVAIGFLAYLLGIDDIPYRIAQIIGGVREAIDKALDWLIEQAMRLGSAALGAIVAGAGGAGPAAPVAAAPDPAAPPATDSPEAATAKAKALGLVRQRVGGGSLSSIDAFHDVLAGVLEEVRPDGLKGLTAVADPETLAISVNAYASVPETATIRWAEVFTGTPVDPKAVAELLELFKTGGPIGNETYAAVAVGGQLVGSARNAADHAEQELVGSEDWIRALALADQQGQPGAPADLSLLINRSPCGDQCTPFLASWIRANGKAHPNVRFILAATSLYAPTVNIDDLREAFVSYLDEIGTLNVPLQSLTRAELERAIPATNPITQLVLRREKATSMENLRNLAGAGVGWELHQLQIREEQSGSAKALARRVKLIHAEKALQAEAAAALAKAGAVGSPGGG